MEVLSNLAAIGVLFLAAWGLKDLGERFWRRFM